MNYGECKICKKTNSLTRHEKISQNVGGFIIPENILWICNDCHTRINSIADSSIHKLKTGKEISSAVSDLQIGNINLYAGSNVCSGSSLSPISFIPPINDPLYIQGYPKDFDKKIFSFNILHKSGTLSFRGGSESGWIYVFVAEKRW